MRVTDPEVLRILLSIGPTETMHFQTGVGRPLDSFCFRGLKSLNLCVREAFGSQVGQHLMAERMPVQRLRSATRDIGGTIGCKAFGQAVAATTLRCSDGQRERLHPGLLGCR